jgi:hypothetical protein
VRINFPNDEHLGIAMLSPPYDPKNPRSFPTTSQLAYKNGQGANFGSGANNCSGTKTRFSENFVPAIFDAAAPFAGRVGPYAPMYVSVTTAGEWRIRVDNYSTSLSGIIGCAEIAITYEPL